jgi:gas vesicle protein
MKADDIESKLNFLSEAQKNNRKEIQAHFNKLSKDIHEKVNKFQNDMKKMTIKIEELEKENKDIKNKSTKTNIALTNLERENLLND